MYFGADCKITASLKTDYLIPTIRPWPLTLFSTQCLHLMVEPYALPYARAAAEIPEPGATTDPAGAHPGAWAWACP